MGDHVASSCSRGPRTEQSRTKLPLWDRKVASPICRALAEARAARVGEGSPCFQALGWEEVAVAGGGGLPGPKRAPRGPALAKRRLQPSPSESRKQKPAAPGDVHGGTQPPQ